MLTMSTKSKALFALIALACAAAPVFAQPFAINWYTIDGGGGTSAGGTFNLSGTIGQPDAGAVMSGGSFALQGGFWVGGVTGSSCGDLDFNNDGSLFDPQDVEAFLSVYSEGPCIPNFQVCDDIDFNNDGGFFDPCDVDSFLLVFSEGPCTPCGL